jgi:hypothetical protein
MNSLEEVLGGAHTVKCELAGEVLASSGTLRLRVSCCPRCRGEMCS